MILRDKEAEPYLRGLLKSDSAIVITPVLDILAGKEELGNIILLEKTDIKIIANKIVLINSKNNGFLFIGTNPTIFNHLFKKYIYGSYTANNVSLNTKFQDTISYDMLTILKSYILKYTKKE